MGLPAHIAALFLTFKVLCTDFHIDYPDLNPCQQYVAVCQGSLPPRTLHVLLLHHRGHSI